VSDADGQPEIVAAQESPEGTGRDEKERAAQSRRNPLRRLYDWVLHWAKTPYASPALFIVAFAESSFFPIPPDFLLIAMAIARRMRALRYALITTTGSILGAMLGYTIGWGLWGVTQDFFYRFIFTPETFKMVAEKYQQHGVWVVFIAAFTPLPYIACTISAGVCGINFPLFVIVSIIGRLMRYCLIAGLIRIFGDTIRGFIEKYFNLLTVAFTILLIAAFVVVKYKQEMLTFVRGFF